MNLKLLAARFYLPPSIKKKALLKLFNVTAKAFKTPYPDDVSKKSFAQLLNEYALFTKNQAQSAPKDNALTDTIQTALFNEAKAMGIRLRRELGVKDFDDFRIAAKIVYRALRIDFTCAQNGEVIIRKCFFSSYYSGAVCALISSLDAGLISGLSGGFTLHFNKRITENSGYCAARIIQ